MSIFQQYNNTIEELILSLETFASTIIDADANKDRLRLGRVKINTDGASNRDDNRSAAAGVIRDSHGNWVVLIESDCLIAIELTKKSDVNLSSSTLIRKFNEVTRCIQMFNFQYVPRKGNMATDSLAKTCTSDDVELRIIDFPNFHVRKLLLEDKIGTF
ncbi:hypothetical protein Goshw_017847, partial [Gossypium schwendimanii]|nr:hypothetical protein [Gossypium schwendimanii]